MLKMSYREKIVALVLIVFVIILIFVMWPIKNIRANIKTDTEKRDTVKVDYDENNRKINEIPTIENNIKKIYEDSKDLNKDFEVHLDNFQIDEYIQKILNKDNDYRDGDKNTVQVEKSFIQSDAETDTLEYYCVIPDVITYPILESADTNGTLMKDTNPVLFDKVENAVVIKSLENQTIEVHRATIDLKFTKEGIFKFIDQMKKDTGVRIVEFKIDDYRFGNQKPVEGVEFVEDLDMKGYSTGTMTLEFYTMQQIQEPRFED